MLKEYPVEHIKRKGLEVFLSGLVLFFLVWGASPYVKGKMGFLGTVISVADAEVLGPKDAVSVSFSNPVIPSEVEKILKIEPATELNIRWSDKNRQMELFPAENWKNSTDYVLSVNGGRNIFGFKFDGQVIFETEALPEVSSMSPAEGEKGVLLGIEDPIIINFDRPLEEYSVKLAFDPMAQFVSEFNEQKTAVKLMPKEELQRGKRYEVSVYLKHRSAPAEEYKKVHGSYFETKPREIENWDNDFAVRLAQAKIYTEPRVFEGKYIDINLKSQVMVLFENGEVLDAYLVSSGKRGMDTPTGTFQVYNKAPKPWSKKYSLFMPYWMALTSSGEYGIHELPEWPGGYKEGANHLGIPVSHGCVRLGVGPAQRTYEWADIGTPIIIHY
ncbi:MAG: ErfK/YbiS/YcfS/YnhG family [Candidatus Moranbacteria bacterium GW2011_GWE2_47_10]|nr:MAG: ErfK/YbiS/YcfS/YnhG family [Candidatus Moranbacteria bacterium GW2011_GWE2_47_10]